MDASRRKTQLAMTAFLRPQPNMSMQLAIRFSNTEMTVVKLAKVMNRKNSVPQKRPPRMPAKTLGRVTKISDGPASGCTPKEKLAGKMIRPLISATKVSSRQMRTASPVSVFSRVM